MLRASNFVSDLSTSILALQNVDEGDEQVAAGGKRKGPDQGKLDEAVEREKAKKQKAKEDAAEKVSPWLRFFRRLAEPRVWC